MQFDTVADIFNFYTVAGLAPNPAATPLGKGRRRAGRIYLLVVADRRNSEVSEANRQRYQARRPTQSATRY